MAAARDNDERQQHVIMRVKYRRASRLGAIHPFWGCWGKDTHALRRECSMRCQVHTTLGYWSVVVIMVVQARDVRTQETRATHIQVLQQIDFGLRAATDKRRDISSSWI